MPPIYFILYYNIHNLVIKFKYVSILFIIYEYECLVCIRQGIKTVSVEIGIFQVCIFLI